MGAGCFFLFKQKTAYEMRISDWSSDVCSSDLAADAAADASALILWEIRLPRTMLGVMVGAALAVAGAMLQGLFRHPLADPGLIGVSSGSALGAVSMIVLGAGPLRSEERRVGTGCDSTLSSWWSPYT